MRRKKIITMIAVLVLLCNFILPVTAFAEDTGNAAGGLTETPAMLSIDNRNCYKGMKCSYSEGYVPSVSNGYATIVLPLLCDKELKDNKLRVSAELGDVSSMPFVCKNYEKTVKLAENTINNGKGKVSGYLAIFNLELNSSRTNGNYPVIFRASGIDKNGNVVSADYTVYVMIKDGKSSTPSEPPKTETEPPIIYTPKVLVKSYQCKKIMSEEENEEPALSSGDKFELTITFWNTSTTENLKNTSVTITSPEGGFHLLSPSNTVFVGNFGAGQTKEVTFEYQANISVLPGQYDFAVSCDYAYGKGQTVSSPGTAKVDIAQKLNVQFDDLQIPSEVVVSDTITGSVQAMNLGKTAIYNVRAVIEADGLNPQGTLFIGNIEAGNAASASVSIMVSGLANGESSYGNTKGKITYYYEDADGNEYSEEREISVSVKSPFSNKPTEPEDEPGQWWVIMLVIGLVIAIFAAVFVIGFWKRRKKYEMAD